MIAWVEGGLREKAPTRVVVDVAGVGYELWIPLSTYAALPDEGKNVSLHVHTAVREDAIQLFGFFSEAERTAFELLLRANRVGPRLAQTILSGITPAVLLDAIRNGSATALRAIPGVGTKVAERILLELRDRADQLAQAVGVAPRGTPISSAQEGTLSALMNLGYSKAEAERVLSEATGEVGSGATIEALVRASLKRIG